VNGGPGNIHCILSALGERFMPLGLGRRRRAGGFKKGVGGVIHCMDGQR